MLVALALTATLGALPACGPLDLDTALALARARSDEVAIRRAEAAASEADVSLARAARWFPSATLTLLTGPSPEARGTITHAEQTNRSLTGLRPFGRVNVDVVQPLFTFGRLSAARDAAEAGVKARALLVDDAVKTVQVRVVQLWWGDQVARRLLAIAADVEGALSEVDQHIADELKRDKGAVSPADRYRVELFRSLVRQRKADATRGRELAREGLAASVGIAPERLLVAERDLDLSEGSLPDVAAARAAAEARRPDLLALDQGIAAREAQIRAERGAALPQFFVGAGFGYAYAPNRDIQLNPWIHDDFNFLFVGAVLGVRQDLAFPLLFARADKARAEKATLERQRDGLARLVAVQVEGAVSDIRAARERLSAAKAALGAGKAWFRSAQLDFVAGLTEAKDLLDAYGGYVESQVGLAQAAYDLTVARARLSQATGEAPQGGNPTCELR